MCCCQWRSSRPRPWPNALPSHIAGTEELFGAQKTEALPPPCRCTRRNFTALETCCFAVRGCRVAAAAAWSYSAQELVAALPWDCCHRDKGVSQGSLAAGVHQSLPPLLRAPRRREKRDKREWDRLEFAAAPKFGDQHLLELARVRTAAKSIQDPAHESALWEAHQVPCKSRPHKPNCSWSHWGPSPSAVGDLCTTTYLVHPVSCSYLPTPLNGPWVKISPDLISRLLNVKKSYPVFYL